MSPPGRWHCHHSGGEVTALTPEAQERDISGFWGLFQRSGHRNTNRKTSGKGGGRNKNTHFVCQWLELWEGEREERFGGFGVRRFFVFTMRVLKGWHGMPRKVADASSLEKFEARLARL